jgi:hypothetical protein
MLHHVYAIECARTTFWKEEQTEIEEKYLLIVTINMSLPNLCHLNVRI